VDGEGVEEAAQTQVQFLLGVHFDAAIGEQAIFREVEHLLAQRPRERATRRA
jgi:hypothetical protein